MLSDVTAEKTRVAPTLNPSKIMQVGMGFWGSKVLLTAVNLDLFTLLGKEPLSAEQVKNSLGLHCTDRHVYDWLDALVSMGFLERKGVWQDAVYTNAEDTGLFLDKNKKSYMGGILVMANNRLFKYWNNLEEGLRSGIAQNENSHEGNMDFFQDLYKDPNKLQEFIDAMSGIQTGNFIALTSQFNFDKYATLLDVGGADGWFSIQVCLRHPSIKCRTFDLPEVAPVAKKKIEGFGLSNRIEVLSGDFTKDHLPKADVIVMGNIIHGMNEEAKQKMFKKVYDSLLPGGVFITVENIIDDERRQNTFGLLMSLNMLIENGDAFDYTFNDFQRWAKAANFTRTEIMPLSGPTSAAFAYK